MRRIAKLLIAGFVVTAASTAIAAPAPAPAAGGGERVNTIIVYGEDPCPASQGGEITVCARKAEAERYRIPAPLREMPSSKSESWSERVLAYETVGREGVRSCSPVGPGGVLGCTQRLIDAAYAEKKAASDVNFAKMIEEERAKRAATTDADAAATQARVEQAERDYEARERAAHDPGARSAPSAKP